MHDYSEVPAGAGEKWAQIVGAGAAGRIHARILQRLGWRVQVYDRDPEAAQGFAHETKAQVGAILRGDFPLTVVAVPASAHRAVAEVVLSGGGAVVVEKPLALLPADAYWLAAHEAADRRLFVAESQCYGGEDSLDVTRMAQAVQAGALGRPVQWLISAMTAYHPQAWCDDLGVGGGAFLEGGAHVLTTARVLFGEAVKWQGSVRCYSGGTGPDNGTILVDYAQGDALSLSIGWGTRGCFDGRCKPLMAGGVLIGPDLCEPWWSPDNHEAMWRHLLRCIGGEAMPVAGLSHAAGAVEDAWRCYEAAGIVAQEV